MIYHNPRAMLVVCSYIMYAIMIHMTLLRHRTGFGVVQRIFTATHLIAIMASIMYVHILQG